VLQTPQKSDRISWYLAKINMILHNKSDQRQQSKTVALEGEGLSRARSVLGSPKREKAASLHMAWGPSCGPWGLPWTPLKPTHVLPEKGLILMFN